MYSSRSSFDFNDREVLAKLGAWVHSHEILRAWLAHGDGGEQFLDTGGLGEGLVEAQVRGIERSSQAWGGTFGAQVWHVIALG